MRYVNDAADEAAPGVLPIQEATPGSDATVPGFQDLAAAIHDYGMRYLTTDLVSGLAAVSVEPTKPESRCASSRASQRIRWSSIGYR
jgi:hypothetical protein